MKRRRALDARAGEHRRAARLHRAARSRLWGAHGGADPRALPAAPFVALDDVGHWPPLEAPGRALMCCSPAERELPGSALSVELRQALLQVTALGFGVDELERPSVGRARVLRPIEPPQQLGARRVQVVVAVELTCSPSTSSSAASASPASASATARFSSTTGEPVSVEQDDVEQACRRRRIARGWPGHAE